MKRKKSPTLINKMEAFGGVLPGRGEPQGDLVPGAQRKSLACEKAEDQNQKPKPHTRHNVK